MPSKFTMLSLLVLTSLAVPSIFASPLEARQTTDACSGLGSGVSSNAASFTLAAFNPNGDNANSTGVPLVVSRVGVVEVSVGPSYGMLSTWASYGQNPFPELSLVDNALIPANEGGYASDLAVTAGAQIEFEFDNIPSELPPPAPIYCIVQNLDPAGQTDTARLAVNGAVDQFSLCESFVAVPEGTGPLINLVYQATEDSGDSYDYSTCYSVVVYVVYSA